MEYTRLSGKRFVIEQWWFAKIQKWKINGKRACLDCCTALNKNENPARDFNWWASKVEKY
jgi:hypothetical protein